MAKLILQLDTGEETIVECEIPDRFKNLYAFDVGWDDDLNLVVTLMDEEE